MASGSRPRNLLAALGGCVATLAALAAAPAAAQPERPASAYAPAVTPTELGLAGYAKVLCSAVFVSGRDPQEAARNSGFFFLAEAERDGVRFEVDRERRSARVSRGGLSREARFYGDQGCIIQQKGREGIFFEPVAVRSALPDAATQAWPMGDATPDEPPAPGVDRARLAAAGAAAFADAEALTAAFLVVHEGRIVAERYGPGVDKDTQLESWSMGKSLTATLLGLLIRDGVYALEQPAPVPEWQAPGDPRARIRISDLLQMSSGLRFIAGQDPDYTPEKGYPDHMLIYTGAIDAFRHSLSRPLQFPPGTEGRYRNSDPLAIGWLVRRAVEQRGEQYLSFPQRALFDRIGIRRQVLETDPYGNFLLTGYDYGTARNWARLGLLYLNDGVWQGRRLLPEGFVRFVSTPAPAWKRPIYGGQFWVNGDGEWPLPKDAYFMAGAGGQRTFVIPSHDLVVVRLGHFRGDRPGMKTLRAALAELMAAVPRSRPEPAPPPVRLLVAHHSRGGHTAALAAAVAEGAREAGAQVESKPVAEVECRDLVAAEALAVGSPVYWSNMAGEVKHFFDRWTSECGFVPPGFPMRDKLGAAFVTGGEVSSGKEVALLTILAAMLGNRMVVLSEGQALGATATTGEGGLPLDAKALAEGRALGRRLAELAGTLRHGRRPPPDGR